MLVWPRNSQVCERSLCVSFLTISRLAENQYHLHVSQELLALGVASMIGSAFQAYPVSGSLPRTVVNAHVTLIEISTELSYTHA